MFGPSVSINQTLPRFSITSQKWVKAKPEDTKLTSNTTIEPNTSGSLAQLLVGSDFESCEYGVLGDIRTPQDGGEDQFPGPSPPPGSNYLDPSSYDPIATKAPGFVYDSQYKTMRNNETYSSPKTLASWSYSQDDDWPTYMFAHQSNDPASDAPQVRNFGFFHHLATQANPPAKHDQKILEQKEILLPMRFKRNATTADNPNTENDETIDPFDSDIYSTCTFEIIISLGSAPLPSGTAKKLESLADFPPAGQGGFEAGDVGQDERLLSLTYPGWTGQTVVNGYDVQYVCTPANQISFNEYQALANNPACWTVTPTQSVIPEVGLPGNFEATQLVDTWLERHDGQLVVVIGDITFSAETMNNPDTENAGEALKSKWKIYYWSSDFEIDDSVEVDPDKEYHCAVVYSKNTESQKQTCDVYIDGKKVKTKIRDADVPNSKLMATAVAGVSQKVTNALNTDPSAPSTVALTYTPIMETRSRVIEEPRNVYNNVGALLYSTPGTNETRNISLNETLSKQVIGKFPLTLLTYEPTEECRVGFHGLRFTPGEALYVDQTITPPTAITDFA